MALAGTRHPLSPPPPVAGRRAGTAGPLRVHRASVLRKHDVENAKHHTGCKCKFNGAQKERGQLGAGLCILLLLHKGLLSVCPSCWWTHAWCSVRAKGCPSITCSSSLNLSTLGSLARSLSPPVAFARGAAASPTIAPAPLVTPMEHPAFPAQAPLSVTAGVRSKGFHGRAVHLTCAVRGW